MTAVLPHNGTATSKAAATDDRVVAKSATDRRLITQFIADRAAVGAIDEEITDGCPSVDENAVRARRGESWGRGFLTKEAGERRATKSGHLAQVWHVTDLGIKALGMPTDSWCVKTSQP